MYDVADVQIEEVLAPIIDNTVSVVEGADEALRLSVLTIISSESSDTHGKYTCIFSITRSFSFSFKCDKKLLFLIFSILLVICRRRSF